MFTVQVSTGPEHFSVSLDRVPVEGDSFTYQKRTYRVRSVRMWDGGGSNVEAALES